jgi:hypothetical protein
VIVDYRYYHGAQKGFGGSYENYKNWEQMVHIGHIGIGADIWFGGGRL